MDLFGLLFGLVLSQACLLVVQPVGVAVALDGCVPGLVRPAGTPYFLLKLFNDMISFAFLDAGPGNL